MTNEIIKYQIEDTDALVSVWSNANAVAHSFLKDEFVAQDMHNIYLPNAETWVLEVNKAPVDYISMLENEIGGLFLDPAHHSKGLGRVLVNHAASIHGNLRVEVFEKPSCGENPLL